METYNAFIPESGVTPVHKWLTLHKHASTSSWYEMPLRLPSLSHFLSVQQLKDDGFSIVSTDLDIRAKPLEDMFPVSERHQSWTKIADCPADADVPKLVIALGNEVRYAVLVCRLVSLPQDSWNQLFAASQLR